MEVSQFMFCIIKTSWELLTENGDSNFQNISGDINSYGLKHVHINQLVFPLKSVVN